MAEAVLERKAKKKTGKKKEKNKQHVPLQSDDTNTQPLHRSEVPVPSPQAQQHAQPDISDRILAITSTSVEQAPLASDKKSLAQKDVGYKDPGISAPKTSEAPKTEIEEVAAKEPSSQQLDSEHESGKVTDKPLVREERALESGVENISLSVSTSSAAAVEKTHEGTGLVSHEPETFVGSQSEPLATTLHSDNVKQPVNEVTLEPDEHVLPELPVNPFEDLQTALDTAVHDDSIVVGSVSAAEDGYGSTLVGVSSEMQGKQLSNKALTGHLVVDEIHSQLQVADSAIKELTVMPAGEVDESDVVMRDGLQEPVMETMKCSNIETHSISQTEAANNDTIAASPFCDTTLPQDKTVTSQPAEASTSPDVEPYVSKGRVQHRKIYREQTYTKELVESSPFKPLTIQQLESLYYNPQLAQNDKFVQEFVQKEISKERHEFYEILMDYYRARMKFLHAEGDIRSLQKNYHGLVESLWQTTDQRVSIQCYCGDNVKCTANHTYSQCSLNEEVLQNVSHVLQAIRTQLHEHFSLHAYSAQLSRFQVESYIHNLFMSCPVLRDIPRNAPVQALPHEIQDQGAGHQIHRLKECISVLFMFQRRPIKDEHFMQDIRAWTERLTSALLRIASFSDHLFILNHALRCPAGVGKWAAKLIQVIPPSCNLQQMSLGGPHLDHAMTILATILFPVV